MKVCSNLNTLDHYSLFTADGGHERDVKSRCVMTMSRCGDLRAVFSSENIPLALKLQIYKTAVCSLLTFGSEAWRLDEKTIAKINGCNARCLSHITHKSAHEEASAKTRTFDLVAAIYKKTTTQVARTYITTSRTTICKRSCKSAAEAEPPR